MRDVTKSYNRKQAAFLSAFAECGTISHASDAAGIARTTHYSWLKRDAAYPKYFEEAKQEACDALEAEARRRAVEGWEEPVFHKGKIVGYRRRYSDTMLAMLLNSNLPEKYRNRVEYSGPNGGPIKTEHTLVQVYIPDNGRQQITPPPAGAKN